MSLFTFPDGFMWGAATAGHQVEGNNVNSDCWLMENIRPTVFAEPSGDAVNSFALWRADLDLVRSLNLNCFRFSLEWARIEPEPGMFSVAMLDHYKALITGCRDRGITPVLTFNHFTTPRWFAGQAGWLNAESPQLFARFCTRAAEHLAAEIGYAMTLNEPNLPDILQLFLPTSAFESQREMEEAVARQLGVPRFYPGFTVDPKDRETASSNQIAAHELARTAIKAIHPDLPVGIGLAISDDQAVGEDSIRDSVRNQVYGRWLATVRDDDFLGVQNYERNVWDGTAKLPPPEGAVLNASGAEVHPPSLAGAVAYAHSMTKLPILITEHGVNTDDDSIRAWLLPAALRELTKAVGGGVPVLGYIHWSLLDNFEWNQGYKPRYGLASVDRTTFERTPKPSAQVLAEIAQHNALPSPG